MRRRSIPLKSHSAFLCLLALAGIMLPGAVGSAEPAKRTEQSRPKRIVSLNLCTDQYLLALADPDQIAGLTPNATNAEMSAAADKARRFHIMGTAAEEVLALNPDLIIGMPARSSSIVSALADRHYAMLDLKSAESYTEIVQQTRQVAAAIGQSARGEALIAQMNRELAALPHPTGKAEVAAYYQRRGFMTGTGTLIDDLMMRIGLVNLAGVLHKPVLSQMSLEEMMAAQPDYLIVESATDRITDQGTEMLHHPLLKDIPRLRVPQAWTVCGGPAYILAARSLSKQLQDSKVRGTKTAGR